MMMNIFERFTGKLLDQIDLIIEYHCSDIQIHIQWSSKNESIRWNLPYLDEECTLPRHAPLFYLCSSTTRSLNPSFYSYWFLLDQSFFRRLFSTITLDDEHLILLISMPDGRILALPEAAKDHPSHPIIWYTSYAAHPVLILGFDYDLNNNLLDAVLASTSTRKFPNMICNHLLLCDNQGCLILINSVQLRRILIDDSIRSASIYSHQLIYLTKNEIRSIAIANLFKPSNEDLINQTKILRFGHFDKLIVGKSLLFFLSTIIIISPSSDGQEIILYYQNGTFERLNHLLPPPVFNHPLRMHSLSNQSKKLACLTSTITHLQSQACVLQRILTKIELFFQLNLLTCLKLIDQQWKLILTEQQLRVFQPQDFLLILLCYLSSSSKDIRIYQLNPNKHWIFLLKDLPSMTGRCQPILLLRCQNQLHARIGMQKILLPLQEHVQEEVISLENYFPEKYRSVKKNSLSSEQYHLALTLRNDAAVQFKSKTIGLDGN